MAVTHLCNLDCFFCHNEGMAGPRRADRAAASPRLGFEALVGIASAHGALGGRQINITGGEPLARPDLVDLLQAIDKRDARLVLNTNAVLADRLLDRPRLDAIDGILASLHTTSDAVFRDRLGGRSAARVMENIVALARHGYAVEVNYSLGPYNRDEFSDVLEFCVRNRLALKAIALVRPHEGEGFYGGDWVDPRWLERLLTGRGAEAVGVRDALGGRTTTYALGGSRVKVKNVARGRLHTDLCDGCPHQAACGEGVYGLRVGVDGLWKPCLLRHDAYRPVDVNRPYDEQILERIDAMVGERARARFVAGPPR